MQPSGDFVRADGAAHDPPSEDSETASGPERLPAQLGSGSQSQDLSRCDQGKALDDRRDQGPQMLHPVAASAEHDDAQGIPGYVLLELEVLISREENREAEGLCPLEECAVLQSLETNLRDRSEVRQVELVCQLDRQRLVNENAHSLPGAHPRAQAP